MTFPTQARISGILYGMNTDFRVALKCFKIIDDSSISDVERALAIVFLVFGFIPDNNLDLFLEKASLFLERGKTDGKSESSPDMDLIYDEPFIFASFMSDYKIDLSCQKLHWWSFLDLLSGLTDSCALSRVRELRNFDVNEIKDAKSRSKMIRAKEAVALPIKRTREEQEALDEFEALFSEEING